MNKHYVLNYLLISVLVLLSSASHAAEIVVSTEQQRNLGITTVPLNQNGLMTSRLFPAEVAIPIGQERVVSTPQTGLIDRLYVAAGQEVKKGQALAHLASQDLISLQRDYLQAQTQKKLADKSLARDEALFKDGIIAQRRYLETQSQHEEASAALMQRKQALKLAGMGDGEIQHMQSASAMGSGITLTAPIAGQVLAQMVVVGQRVDMAMPLYRIGQLNPLWLEIHAPLEALPALKLGMLVRIPKLDANGKLIAIVRNVNKTDQTLNLRAEINQGTDKLSPGQLVEAEIQLETQASHYSLPKSALVRQGKQSWVFVQSKQGFNGIPVTVLSEQGSEVVVRGDFTGHEVIANAGTAALKGMWLGIGAN
jgi:membrane fusion protein, heavy metal efflux system